MFELTNQSWASKTYGQVRSIAAEDGSVLVVPVASMEQHGHHLPVATDSLLVTAVAQTAAARLADHVPRLVLPPIWTGYSPHHMFFKGTVTLEHEHLLRLVEDVATSALDSGFDSVLLLNGHGGNIPLIGAAVSTVGRRRPDVEVLGLTYYQLANEIIEEVRDSETGGMAHGGEFETSMMLHLYPDLVDEDSMEGTNLHDPYELRGQDLFDSGPLSIYRPFEAYSDSGALGDPANASAEKGEHLLGFLADELARLLEQMHDENVSNVDAE